MFNATRCVPLVLSAFAVECLAGGPTLVLRTGDTIMTGDAGTPDLDFDFLRLAQVGPSGDVAFNAERLVNFGGFLSVDTATGVIPRDSVGGRQATAHTLTGMPIDGLPLLTYNGFAAPLTSFNAPTMSRVGRTGDAAFSGSINGNDGNIGVALLRADAGSSVRPIVVPGACDMPPVAITNAYDGIAASRRFLLTDDGRTLAVATRGCVSDIGFERAVVMENAGHVTQLIAPGDPAPGAPGETVELVRTVDFNRSGEMAIYGGIDDQGTTVTGFIPAIWTGTPDALSILVRDRDPVPGQQGDVFRLAARLSGPDGKEIAIHRDGDVSFIARTETQLDGVYRTEQGTPALLFRAGDPAPGTSDFFSSIGSSGTFLEAAGTDTTAILTRWRDAPLFTPATQGLGVWLSRGQDLELLLREGDAYGSDRVVRLIYFHSGAPDGNVAIVARVSDALDPEADRSLVLYAWSPVDEQLRVVAEQDLDLGLSPVFDFDIEDFFDPDGGLAENGHIVYRLRRPDPADEFGAIDELFYDRLPSVNDLACAADLDGDGDVDLGDFGVFASAFDTRQGDDDYMPEADIDADGDVDLGDFGAFGAQFGRTDCGM